MDSLINRLATYSSEITYEKLPLKVTHEVKRLLLDGLGCALGGYDSEITKISTSIAERYKPQKDYSRIFVKGTYVSPDWAAFVNGCMIRYLDFNDMVPAGHPSDGLGAILAVAEAEHICGKNVIAAIAVYYEVFTALGQSADYMKIGWDQGWLLGIALTCGLSNLLEFPKNKIANAIAITAVAHVSLRQTRAGTLSMWKGAAAPYAAGEAVRSTLLAQEGMTGPDMPFEGHHGAEEMLIGKITLPVLGRGDGTYHLFQTRYKYWPVEYFTQSSVWLALRLRDWSPVDAIESIHVEAHRACWSEVGSEPEKWNPKTRETADHSLPFIMAISLREGEILPSSFEPKFFLDQNIREIMNKITVSENPEYTAVWPEKMILRVTAKNNKGNTVSFIEENPKGHISNPMSDSDIENKFFRLGKGVLPDKKLHNIIDIIWSLDNIKDTSDLLTALYEEW